MDIPEYNFVTHSRSEFTHRVEPVDVVIVEGILVLHMEAIRLGGGEGAGGKALGRRRRYGLYPAFASSRPPPARLTAR